MDKKIVLQNGVVFTYDSDDGSDIVHDINIPDGVEEVELCMDVATSAHAALIQMEVCVVLLPIVIHLLMRAMTFAGLYIILRIKTTPDEFLVYCNLTSNDGKKRMMAAGVNADFIDETDKKLTDVIERHSFFSIADRRVFQYT